MTSYFAVLGLPEALLIENESLRDVFHSAGALLHPDADHADAASFQQVNDAYSILRQPARRLMHLLDLHGKRPITGNHPPRVLTELFFQIGGCLQAADSTLRQHEQAGGPLQKALLLDPLFQLSDQLSALLQIVQNEEALHMDDLVPLQNVWPELTEEQWQFVAEKAEALSYLGKWRREIQERQTSIAETTSGAIL